MHGVRISESTVPVSLKLLLPLLLALGVLAPVVSPVEAAAPHADAQRRDAQCRADAPYYDPGTLPGRMLLAVGNGSAGSILTIAAADTLSPGTHTSELVSRVKPRLTRAKLEAMEHRGVHSAYFSGWHAQVRTQTRRLVARVATCPDEAQVLIGYSQGALVLRATLRNLTRTAKGRGILDHIAGVVLIGDPAANRREKIKRYGGAKGSGVIRARIPLPRVLVARHLVTSVCAANDSVCSSTPKTRKGTPTKAAGRRALRHHLAYDVGHGRQMDIDTVAEKAVEDMSADLDRRYRDRPQWTLACYVYPSSSSGPCYQSREGDAFSAPATSAGYRLVAAATTAPAGVSVAPDLTISGVVPDRDHDDVVVAFTSSTVAPAVVRRAHLSLGSWPRQTARPGVKRISHAMGGGAANGASSQPDLSADGQHVAFVSTASDLAAGDSNGAGLDVFLWDRATDTTKRLAVGDASTAWPDVSADGHYVEFTTKAQLAGDTDTLADAFVWDTQAGTVQLASPGTAVPVSAGSITPDGSTVFFRQDPPGTVPAGNTVSRWDRAGDAVSPVPPPTGWSWTVDPDSPRPWASSPDGRYVVAQSTSATQALVWDRQLDAQQGKGCVVSSGMVTGASGAVAADGTVFSFTNYMPNNRITTMFRVVCGTTTGERLDSATGEPFTGSWQLVEGGPSVRDRSTGVVTSPTTEPTRPGDVVKGFTGYTADGSTIVFGSTAKNIVEQEQGYLGRSEVYLWDRTVSP